MTLLAWLIISGLLLAIAIAAWATYPDREWRPSEHERGWLRQEEAMPEPLPEPTRYQLLGPTTGFSAAMVDAAEIKRGSHKARAQQRRYTRILARQQRRGGIGGRRDRGGEA